MFPDRFAILCVDRILPPSTDRHRSYSGRDHRDPHTSVATASKTRRNLTNSGAYLTSLRLGPRQTIAGLLRLPDLDRSRIGLDTAPTGLHSTRLNRTRLPS